MNIINNSFILISKKLSPNDHAFINSDKYDLLEKMIDDLDCSDYSTGQAHVASRVYHE